MLTISDMQLLRAAYSAYDATTPEQALARLGDPSDEQLIGFAVEQMACRDRNVRVLMLRVLRHQQGEIAKRGVLAGLHDETRRVCAVAIQACPNYLAYGEVVARLEAIARDSTLKRKLRRRALSMLAGNDGRLRGDLTPAVCAALTRLMADEAYRFSIAFGLAQLELTARVKTLLEIFADAEDERERRTSRRALGGERVIHIDGYVKDAALHARIMERCDIAHGRMFYWIPRAGLPIYSLP